MLVNIAELCGNIGGVERREWKMRDHEKYGGGKCRTGKHGTKWQGWNSHGKGRTGKHWTKFTGVEIAGLENAGPNLQGWKRQDHHLWNAKHRVRYIL